MMDAVVTVSVLNLRSGPGTEFPVVGHLVRHSKVTVIETKGNWLSLRLNGNQGFAHKNFVSFSPVADTQGFLCDREELWKQPLTPQQAIDLHRSLKLSLEERMLARTWNECGGLVATLCSEIGIEAAEGVAVLCAESSGDGFEPDGILKVRFENHILWHRWARQSEENQTAFAVHFRFGYPEKWLGHEYRHAAETAWLSVHDRQESEWEALEIGRRLNETEALCSTSMGGPQIMGSQHASIGYQTVQDMFGSFSHPEKGNHAQIIGLFDFVRGPRSNSPLVAALQRDDFVSFASRYNGPGRAFEYGELIERYCIIFRRLQP